MTHDVLITDLEDAERRHQPREHEMGTICDWCTAHLFLPIAYPCDVLSRCRSEAALTAARVEVARLEAEKRTMHILLGNIHNNVKPNASGDVLMMVSKVTEYYAAPPQRDPAGDGGGKHDVD